MTEKQTEESETSFNMTVLRRRRRSESYLTPTGYGVCFEFFFFQVYLPDFFCFFLEWTFYFSELTDLIVC